MIMRYSLLLSLLIVAGFTVAQAQSRRPASRIPTSRKAAGCPPLTQFKNTMAADGPSADGSTRLSYHLYKAPNGIDLRTTYGEFDTPKAAQGELDYQIKPASRILVNGWELDQSGDVVGRRAEAIFRSSNGSAFSLLWTWGRYFHEVSSVVDCRSVILTSEKRTRLQLKASD